MRPTPPRQRRTRTATAIAIVSAGLLTACTTSTLAPTHAATTAAMPQSTGTSSAGVSAPAAVPAPTSVAGAIAAANASLTGYYVASFASGAAGGTELDHVTPWATGPALRNEALLAAYLQRNHFHLEGAPIQWTLDSSRSTATQTTANSGVKVPYGAAELVGCAESTNHPVGNGAPAWTTKGQRFPWRWIVIYDVASHRWLVEASTLLSPTTAGTPSCG